MDTARSRQRARWIDRGILFVAVVVSFWVAFRIQRAERLGESVLPLALTVMVTLSLSVVYLWTETRRLGRMLGEMTEALDDLRFGSGVRRDRDAVDILVKALRAPDERARTTALRTLRKISGLDLGEDPRTWEEWWAVERKTFVRAGSLAPDKVGPEKP